MLIRDYDIQERRTLVEVAQGKSPADVVVSNVNLVDVITGDIVENIHVVIKGRRIARVSDSIDDVVGRNTLLIDGRGRYAVPGFIDLHIHIESSMLDPIGFSKIALRHGTTAVVADPHEITNVLGVDGLKIFVDASKKTPLKILVEVPSCVPATNPQLHLETVKHVIDSKVTEEIVDGLEVVGLGEVMDFVSVLRGEEDVFRKIAKARRKGLLIDGHAPLLSGRELDAYIAAGILSDHESTSMQEALEKARKGMFVYIREGSAWRDLASIVGLLKEKDCKLCAFVSDDVNVMDLVARGHMDRIVNLAIELGLDPITAVQYATINPSLRLCLVDELGVIAPGRLADLFLTSRIEYVDPETVIANGEVVYYDKKMVKQIPTVQYPEYALNTVKLSEEKINTMIIPPRGPLEKKKVAVNVIQVNPGSSLTKRVIEELIISEGVIKTAREKDVMYVGVVERHLGTGRYFTGFIKGLRFNAGAIAQTVAHDTHNLIFAGWNEEDIRLAVKRVVRNQGGIVIVDKGQVIAEIPLKLAGLMSIEEPEVVYERYVSMINKLSSDYGVEFESFFMTLALVSLPVIPEIRITDRGLVDVKAARHIPLIAT